MELLQILHIDDMSWALFRVIQKYLNNIIT